MTKTAKPANGPAILLGLKDRVAIIAGSGRLPVNVAEDLDRHGHPPFVLLVRGENPPDSPLRSFEHEDIGLADFATLLPRLKRRGVTHVVLAGGISRRPSWSEIRLSFGLLRYIPVAIAAFARGDDGLLRSLIGEIEKGGVRVVGAHEIVPDLLAGEGPLTRTKPLRGDLRDLDAAYAAARAIGALDIGQGAIAIGGRVIALEGVEGTDGLLERTKALRGHGRLAGKTRGVLVKCAKPAQELRADLPAIGRATIEAAHAAGLAGVGVEAGRALVLDGAELTARADELGLFVVGLPQGAMS